MGPILQKTELVQLQKELFFLSSKVWQGKKTSFFSRCFGGESENKISLFGLDYFRELNLASKAKAASTSKNLYVVDFQEVAKMAHNMTGQGGNKRCFVSFRWLVVVVVVVPPSSLSFRPSLFLHPKEVFLIFLYISNFSYLWCWLVTQPQDMGEWRRQDALHVWRLPDL